MYSITYTATNATGESHQSVLSGLTREAVADSLQYLSNQTDDWFFSDVAIHRMDGQTVIGMQSIYTDWCGRHVDHRFTQRLAAGL